MYYLEKTCNVCGEGILGFLKCSDSKTVVVMCEECNSVWLKPDEVSDLNPIYPEAPEYLLPGSDISISQGGATWASIEEIKTAGFEKYASEERQYKI